MRTKLDIAQDDRTELQPDDKPYPSWDELLGRLRRDRSLDAQATAAQPSVREWHDLVADMIIGR